MNQKQQDKKSNINKCLHKINQRHKQRLGGIGAYIGMFLICIFALVLLPLYLFMYLFNYVYFWFRKQKRIDPKPYFNFDRHRIAHLRFADRVWCEYCEWANGTLQWTLAITNEIERRYCPIKNQCHPHCEKAKKWRDTFLDYECRPDDIDEYYDKRYLQESDLEK